MNTEIITDHILLEQIDINNDDISVRISGDIDTDCATAVCDKLLQLDKRGLDFIPVFIHSGGGHVDDLLTILNVIDMLSSKVMTICLSCACSAAAVIFALGSNNMRIIAPNAYLMFHESSMGAEGKQGDIFASNAHFIKIDKMINKKVEQHLQLDKNFFEKHSTDLYLHAKEAHRLGIATHVGFPVIRMHVSLEMSYEIKCNKRHEIDDTNKKNKYQKILSGANTEYNNPIKNLL